MVNPAPSNPDLKKLGNEADAVLKPKVSLPLWVVGVIALVANVIGVLLHI